MSLIHNNYLCLYGKYLAEHYNDLLSSSGDGSTGDTITLKIKNKFTLNSADINNHNYNMWIFVHTTNNSLTNYMMSKTIKMSKTNTQLIQETFNKYYSNTDKQIIFSIGNVNQWWPKIYFDNKYKLYASFKNTDEDEQNYKLLNRMPLNKWCNLNIQINNNVLSVSVDGKLEVSINISILNKNNKQMNNLYLYSNKDSIENDGFTGYLNYLNYYNSILSPETIKNIYKNYIPTFRSLNNNVNKFQNSENKDIFNTIKNNMDSMYKFNFQTISDKLVKEKNKYI